MASKRSKKIKRSPTKRSSSSTKAQGRTWRGLLSMLALIPLAVGLLLIAATLTDFVVWGSVLLQFVLGVLIALASFAALNALQKQWFLAAGWLLLGVAAFVWVNWLETWVRGFSYLLGGLGLFFILREFVQRYQQQHRPKAKK